MTYDLIIIGGGPTAITAGIYAARQKLKTLLITESFGGQIVKKAVNIENYPGFEKISSKELIKNFEKHLRKFDLGIEIDSVIKLEKKVNFLSVFTKKNKFQAKAVIIASGRSPQHLKIPGEKEFLGKGVSYCVQCDGPLFENKTVAVIGGGNAAFEAALFLSKIAKKIYILEYSPKVKADKINQGLVKNSGKCEVITNVVLKEIKGDKFVSSLVFEDKKISKEKTLSVEGVFIEIGFQPAISFVNRDLVDFNEKNEIKINPKTCKTKTVGLFAAGDVTDIKNKQIVIAAGEGAKAALSAAQYLMKKDKYAKN
jgi:thioredoxin-disulfide reductase